MSKVYCNTGCLTVLAINKRSTKASQKKKKNQFYILRFRTNIFQRSIKYTGAKVWNDMPNEMKNNYFSTFKRIYKKQLILLVT